MQFKPGHDERRNLKGRPRGAKDRRTLIIKALEEVYGETGELGFWTEIGYLAKAGDTTAMQLIAARLVPPLKSVEGDPKALLEIEHRRLEIRAEYEERIIKARTKAGFSHFVHLADVDITECLAKMNEIRGLSDEEVDARISTLQTILNPNPKTQQTAKQVEADEDVSAIKEELKTEPPKATAPATMMPVALDEPLPTLTDFDPYEEQEI